MKYHLSSRLFLLVACSFCKLSSIIYSNCLIRLNCSSSLKIEMSFSLNLLLKSRQKWVRSVGVEPPFIFLLAFFLS